MHWPDIFFKARKPRQDSALLPPKKTEPESPKPVIAENQPPAVKPLPVGIQPQATATPAPLKIEPSGTTTRTLPATHGVVLRPPVRPVATPSGPTNGPGKIPAPLKNIEELMAEADPARALSQTGNVRALKQLPPDPDATKGPPEAPGDSILRKSPETDLSAAASSPAGPVTPSASLPVTPPPQPAAASPPAAMEKSEATPKAEAVPPAASATAVSTGPAATDDDDDSPFILKPNPVKLPAASPPREVAPAPAPVTSFGSIFRRKAKMTEVARIVLPPRREEPEPPASSDPSPTVVPASFPVAGAAHGTDAPDPAAQVASAPGGIAPGNSTEAPSGATSAPKENASKPAVPEAGGSTPGPAHESIPPAEKQPLPPAPDSGLAPKVDPEAHKSPPAAEPPPKVDPEAHKPAPKPAAPMPLTKVDPSPAAGQPEKREFHLANGERVAGIVLSETPEAVYIDHGTLGVLTIPRAQIARRLVEIILINGDRIVGDIMAETADTLYVRHASLGMLTVPRAQRSTRVVEAILKDGDRILGELMTETDTFTVIRSATLGTITVPHNKVAMLNRKIEQIELKSLPPPGPELKDKASA